MIIVKKTGYGVYEVIFAESERKQLDKCSKALNVSDEKILKDAIGANLDFLMKYVKD